MYLDYEKILKDYNYDLVNKLRGLGNKNLQHWVPEENIIISLLNLCFSISENDVKSFIIEINKNKFTDSSIEELKKTFNKFSNFSISINRDKFRLSLEKINKNNLETILNGFFKNKKNTIFFEKKEKFESKKTVISNEQINILKNKYYVNNSLIVNKLSKKEFEENNFDYVGEFKNNKIGVYIKNKIIKDCKFFSEENKIEIFFLDKFCELIKDLPLFEAYEHGTIKLEYSIRNNNIRNSVPGIITALANKKIFLICNAVIREVWLKYKKRHKTEIKNLYDLPLSLQWSNLSEGDKINKIKDSIKEFEKISSSENSLIFESMNKDNIRITLSFEKKCKVQNKATLLLSFEKFMRKTVDKRIEIFNKEMVDVNILRIKNSPIKESI